jgi:hypothetical protein
VNGIHFLVFAATVFGAVYFIPRAFAADRLWLTLQGLDDEELAAFLAEYPDALDWRGWR